MGKVAKGIGGVLFGKQGKSQNSSSTGNVNNTAISGALNPVMNSSAGGQSMMGNMLGVGGAPAQTGALENFANSGGFKFMQEQGMKGIESNKAAAGLLNSGSYGTALADYNHGLTSTYLNQYMSNLNDYTKNGISAAGVLSDSGKVSQSQGTEKGGKKGLAGDIIAAVAKCDRRLKENIELLGTFEDGLNFYRWNYKPGFGLPEGKHVGFMADEVKEIRPAAYVPNVMGEYAGVNLLTL